MRHSIEFGIIGLVLVIMFGAVKGHSQTGKGLVADIPFEFYVKGKLMAGGTYEFVSATTAYDPAPLIIRTPSSSSRKAVVPVATVEDRVKYASDPVVVFRRYGNEYFLAAIHNGSTNLGLRVIPGKRERELQKAHRQAKMVSIRPTRI